MRGLLTLVLVVVLACATGGSPAWSVPQSPGSTGTPPGQTTPGPPSATDTGSAGPTTTGRSNAGAAGFAAIVVVVGVVMFGLGARWAGRRRLESLAVLQPPPPPHPVPKPEQPPPVDRLLQEAKARREEAAALQRQVDELQHKADEKWKEAGLLQAQVERPTERAAPGWPQPRDGPPQTQHG